MKRLKTLEKLFQLDLTALSVEINTSNFRARLFSEKIPANTRLGILDDAAIERLQSKAWLAENDISQADADQYIADDRYGHVARFPLYLKSERETFLHDLPWS